MARRNLNELQYFVTVAREGSFTKAAAQLGITPSALSQVISALEAQLGIRLLNRTTRSVRPTDAGERLMNSLGSRFDEIDHELEMLSALRDKPAGTVRITCADFILQQTLLPKLTPLLQQYPDIQIEFDVYYGFRDIVAERFDAGIRLGGTIDKDMVAIPISAGLRMAAVATPDYFHKHGEPATPKDLMQHNCINIRFPTHGGLYVWEFEKNGVPQNVHVTGQLVFNSTPHIVQAALQGLGIAFLPEDEFAPYLAQGLLQRTLTDWCQPFDGFYLYYPSRKQPSPAFSMVIDALRL
ncbi:LysR family transcriptional regulator [Rheinheimera marina]|uniref:LysR family transcriptional regulator n=1 Tax=Rheinheimera marina TaxID=1774958 RepID=A0ABV9JGT9_9GAMM